MSLAAGLIVLLLLGGLVYVAGALYRLVKGA